MFTALALGGGGVRGALHIGALKALEVARGGSLLFPDGVWGSSIGSIVATAVAFNLKSSQIQEMMTVHFNLHDVLPRVRLANLTGFPASKGLYDMALLEATLLRAFDSQGVDLRGKTIGDAPQRLHIIASDISARKRVVLEGDVPLLKSLQCSCAIPLVFQPQLLNNNLYLDGDLFKERVDSSITLPSNCLSIYINIPTVNIRPAMLCDMTIAQYVYSLYRSEGQCSKPNTIYLQDDTVSVLQELTVEDKERLLQAGFLQTLAYLKTRRVLNPG